METNMLLPSYPYHTVKPKTITFIFCKIPYNDNTGTLFYLFQMLVKNNHLSDKIIVLPGKIEEISLPEAVDVIISEPMGYMLFNERMLESYLHSKKWLKANGELANPGSKNRLTFS